MSAGDSRRFRRGADAIREASGAHPRDYETIEDWLDGLGVRWKREAGGFVRHACPVHKGEHLNARTHSETGLGHCFVCEQGFVEGSRGWRVPGFPGTEDWDGERPSARPERDLTPFLPVLGRKPEPFEPAPSPARAFRYEDPDGNLLGEKRRHALPGGGKFFTQHRPAMEGEEVETEFMGVVSRREARAGEMVPRSFGDALYRLPELAADLGRDPDTLVYLCEGEKDADALRQLGLAATAFNGRIAPLVPEFEGLRVAIVADRDEAGCRKALDLRDVLQPHAREVSVLLPAVGKDVSDHLHNGRGVDELIPVALPEIGEGGEPGAARGAKGYVVLSDEDVEYEPPRWLWRDWIVLGGLNVLAGDGGCGKTHFMVGMAARLSRGDLPGDHRGKAGTTVFLSAEDDDARLKGLYRAAGGSPGKLKFVRIPRDGFDDHPTLPGDLGLLREAIREAEAGLVVIDPGMSFVDVRESHNDQQLRRAAFGPLARLAMDTGAAIVFLVHLNKGQPGMTFRQRINGSVGLTNAPRSVLGMARAQGEEERTVLAHVKGNLTKPPTSLVFEFAETEMELDGRQTHLTHLRKVEGEEGETALTADDLVARPREARETKADRIDSALMAALEAGPVPSGQLLERLEADLGEPVSRQSLGEARGRLGLATWRIGRASYTGREEDEPRSAEPESA